MKTSRRRLDVDVEELDRVIDAAENGPLSKADCQKLETLWRLPEGLLAIEFQPTHAGLADRPPTPSRLPRHGASPR